MQASDTVWDEPTRMGSGGRFREDCPARSKLVGGNDSRPLRPNCREVVPLPKELIARRAGAWFTHATVHSSRGRGNSIASPGDDVLRLMNDFASPQFRGFRRRCTPPVYIIQQFARHERRQEVGGRIEADRHETTTAAGPDLWLAQIKLRSIPCGIEHAIQIGLADFAPLGMVKRHRSGL
jgi:hypothetical protein